VQRNGCTLRMVKNQTKAICRTAVAQTPSAVDYIKIEL
jgi:hypothetical protein